MVNGHISIVVQDADGLTTAIPEYFTAPTATIAQIVEWAQNEVQNYDVCGGAQVVRCRIELDVPLPSGIKLAPLPGSEIEKRLLVNFSVTGSPNLFSIAFPAWPDPGFQQELSGRHSINTEVAPWKFFLNGFDNVPADPIRPTDRYFYPLRSSLETDKTFRKARKALSRSK